MISPAKNRMADQLKRYLISSGTECMEHTVPGCRTAKHMHMQLYMQCSPVRTVPVLCKHSTLGQRPCQSSPRITMQLSCPPPSPLPPHPLTDS